jgi:hypothetical protein
MYERFHIICLGWRPPNSDERRVTDGAVTLYGEKFYPQPNHKGLAYDGSLEGRKLLFDLTKPTANSFIGVLTCADADVEWVAWATEKQMAMNKALEEVRGVSDQ